MGNEGRSQILVTGGCGFIGRRLVRELLKTGAQVTVADLKPFPDKNVRSIVGDLCDPSVVAHVVHRGLDTIFHLAAITSVLSSVNDPAGTYQLNVDVTARLLEQARIHGVHSFVLASTNAVVGDVGHATITEAISLKPLTPYGATKAAAEMLVSCYSANYKMSGVSLRFTNAYGPGMEMKDSFVPRLMRAARDGTSVQIYGDGTQLRDLIHVDDVVAGLLIGWRTRFSGPLIIGSGKSVSVNDILKAARIVTGAEIPIKNIKAKPGEMPAVIVDISAARALGYEPRYDLKSGLATMWPEYLGLT